MTLSLRQLGMVGGWDESYATLDCNAHVMLTFFQSRMKSLQLLIKTLLKTLSIECSSQVSTH